MTTQAAKVVNLYSIDSGNAIWAGSGRLVDGCIQDCGAVWSDDQDETDDVYEAIDEAIAGGLSEVRIDMADGTTLHIAIEVGE